MHTLSDRLERFRYIYAYLCWVIFEMRSNKENKIEQSVALNSAKRLLNLEFDTDHTSARIALEYARADLRSRLFEEIGKLYIVSISDTYPDYETFDETEAREQIERLVIAGCSFRFHVEKK